MAKERSYGTTRDTWWIAEVTNPSQYTFLLFVTFCLTQDYDLELDYLKVKVTGQGYLG